MKERRLYLFLLFFCKFFVSLTLNLKIKKMKNWKKEKNIEKSTKIYIYFIYVFN